MRSVASVLLILAVTASVGKCLVFSPNELAAKLRSLEISDWDIPTIVCVAHNASQLKTDYTSSRLDIGYNYYGIFGIPDKLLNLKPCSHLTKALALDDSIEDDLDCLMKTIKDGGYLMGNRAANLGVFTPHDVDLTKCFNWWDSLPPFSPKNKADLTEKVADDSKTKKDIDPVNHTIDCSAGVATNLLLLLLNVSLMGMCAIGYFILKQLRINRIIMKFNEQPLI